MNLRLRIFLLTAAVVASCVLVTALLVQQQVFDVPLEGVEKRLSYTIGALGQTLALRPLTELDEDTAEVVSYLADSRTGLVMLSDSQVLLHNLTHPPISPGDHREVLLTADASVPAAFRAHIPVHDGTPATSPVIEGAVRPLPLEAVAHGLAPGLKALRDGSSWTVTRIQSKTNRRRLGDEVPPAATEVAPPPRTAATDSATALLGRGHIEVLESEPLLVTIYGTRYLAQLVRPVGLSHQNRPLDFVFLHSVEDSAVLAAKLRGIILESGLWSLAAACLVTWIGARWISRPLRRLAETMSRIARSGSSQHPPVELGGGREVRLFQDAFRRMLDSIERSHRERERSYVEAVGAVMAAIDRRDQESAGHSYRVAYYAVALARELGQESDDLRAVEWGALLHDVGKIAVPDAILRKSGKLNPEEWAIMRQHPSWGYEMLADVQFLRPALDIVYNHHERWDGTGYPRGLQREEIPLAARIFSTVDTYDAITSDRHYRRAGSHQMAVEELRRVAGTQLDPSTVEAFLRIPEIELRRLRGLTHQLSQVLKVPPPLRELLTDIQAGTVG